MCVFLTRRLLSVNVVSAGCSCSIMSFNRWRGETLDRSARTQRPYLGDGEHLRKLPRRSDVIGYCLSLKV